MMQQPAGLIEFHSFIFFTINIVLVYVNSIWIWFYLIFFFLKEHKTDVWMPDWQLFVWFVINLLFVGKW